MKRAATGNAEGSDEEPTMRLFPRKKAPRDPVEPGWFQRLVMPRGHPPNRKLEEIKRAAEADVEAMEAEDRKYFRQDGPGRIEDDL
jgi:hypothetical protein